MGSSVMIVIVAVVLVQACMAAPTPKAAPLVLVQGEDRPDCEADQECGCPGKPECALVDTGALPGNQVNPEDRFFQDVKENKEVLQEITKGNGDSPLIELPQNMIDFDRLSDFYGLFSESLDEDKLKELLYHHSDKFPDETAVATAVTDTGISDTLAALKHLVKREFSWRDCEAWQNCADKWHEYLYRTGHMAVNPKDKYNQEYSAKSQAVPVNIQPKIEKAQGSYEQNQQHHEYINGQKVSQTQEVVLPPPHVPGRDQLGWQEPTETVPGSYVEHPYEPAPQGDAAGAQALGYATYPDDTRALEDAESPSRVPAGEITDHTGTGDVKWQMDTGHGDTAKSMQEGENVGERTMHWVTEPIPGMSETDRLPCSDQIGSSNPCPVPAGYNGRVATAVDTTADVTDGVFDGPNGPVGPAVVRDVDTSVPTSPTSPLVGKQGEAPFPSNQGVADGYIPGAAAAASSSSKTAVAAVEEQPPAEEEQPAAVEEQPAAVEEQPAAVEEQPPAEISEQQPDQEALAVVSPEQPATEQPVDAASANPN